MVPTAAETKAARNTSEGYPFILSQEHRRA
jgi:hypothetical protein